MTRLAEAIDAFPPAQQRAALAQLARATAAFLRNDDLRAVGYLSDPWSQVLVDVVQMEVLTQ